MRPQADQIYWSWQTHNRRIDHRSEEGESIVAQLPRTRHSTALYGFKPFTVPLAQTVVQVLGPCKRAHSPAVMPSCSVGGCCDPSTTNPKHDMMEMADRQAHDMNHTPSTSMNAMPVCTSLGLVFEHAEQKQKSRTLSRIVTVYC